jgi:hypothetical protein
LRQRLGFTESKPYLLETDGEIIRALGQRWARTFLLKNEPPNTEYNPICFFERGIMLIKYSGLQGERFFLM